MQAVGVFVAGYVAEFVAFGDDFSVGVVAEFPESAAWQYEANQPTDAVPLILSQRAMLILKGNLPSQVVIAIALKSAIGQLFFNELSTLIPH